MLAPRRHKSCLLPRLKLIYVLRLLASFENLIILAKQALGVLNIHSVGRVVLETNRAPSQSSSALWLQAADYGKY